MFTSGNVAAALRGLIKLAYYPNPTPEMLQAIVLQGELPQSPYVVFLVAQIQEMGPKGPLNPEGLEFGVGFAAQPFPVEQTGGKIHFQSVLRWAVSISAHTQFVTKDTPAEEAGASASVKIQRWATFFGAAYARHDASCMASVDRSVVRWPPFLF